MTKTLVIFGGSGFIGSNIIRRLSKLDFRIIVPTSNLRKSMSLKLSGSIGQILPIKYNDLNNRDIKHIIKKSDCVINLKTIWSESKNKTFKSNIYTSNKLIVDSIKESKIRKYIYFSGIGVKVTSLSKRAVAIANSENYIKNNLNNYSIIRPSIVIGNQDKFLNKLVFIFKLSFLIPLICKGVAKIQPSYVDDIALAVEKLVIKKEDDCNIYELGGNLILNYKDLYKIIIKEMDIIRILIPIPFIFVKMAVFFIEKLPIELINREQLELFKEDNLVGEQFLKYEDLDIEVTDTIQVIKKIINNYK